MSDTPPAIASAPKSRTVYVVLAILFGHLGIHNFFAGDKKAGLIKLLVSLLTCGIGGIPMWIWAIIDAVNVKKDANGVDFN
jgi:TM2 domain-containing membrane protein YozV